MTGTTRAAHRGTAAARGDRRHAARTEIGAAGTPFAVPGEDLVPARLGTVLAVLHLIFNQGWGDQRRDAAQRAYRRSPDLTTTEPERRFLERRLTHL